MRIGITGESRPGENRVAMVPEVAARLIGAGHEVLVEKEAGARAWFADSAYIDKGAEILASRSAVLTRADVVCMVHPPSAIEASTLREKSALLSFLQPVQQQETVLVLRDGGVTSFSLDLLPRISRAQSMDALSSQATVSGYRAALIACQEIPKFFPMFMTAAGTVPPARVLVMGAGVAGLQAIATCRRLGAIVRAYDVRSAAKEEVMSLGATFVELSLELQEGSGGYASQQSAEHLERQRELIAGEVAVADVVITTAAIPGRKAPVLVTADMVKEMAPGSVIVDLAAETGGNCELTVAGQRERHSGVLVIGAVDLASTMPTHASFLYARNIAEFVNLVSKDGELSPDFSDEIVAGCCVTRDHEILHEPTRALIEGEVTPL